MVQSGWVSRHDEGRFVVYRDHFRLPGSIVSVGRRASFWQFAESSAAKAAPPTRPVPFRMASLGVATRQRPSARPFASTCRARRPPLRAHPGTARSVNRPAPGSVNSTVGRVARGAVVIAAAILVVTVSGAHWLGVQLPLLHSSPSPSARAVSSTRPTATPDPYAVMGTLRIHGRTIRSARLAPGESAVVEWLDNNQVLVVEIVGVGGWPSDRTSLPEVVRGLAVVHELLVPTSTQIYDVVPLAGQLNVSVCSSSGSGDRLSYRLKLVGRTVAFDYPEPLHFANYQDTLLVTANGEVWDHLRQAGATPVPCRGI